MVFAQVMTVVTATVAALIGIGLGTRALWRFGSRTARPAVPAASRDEIERLQNAIDAIAIEVERISEAQRFTVTLLSNRLPNPATDHAGELPVRAGGLKIETPR